MKKNTKILIGVGLAGAGLWWYMNRKKKPSDSATTPEEKDTLESTEETSVDTNTKDPKTREEKENYVIENTTSSDKEEKTGFDGDRFQFDPTVGYEMPVGTVQETGESDTWNLNIPEDDAFDVMSSADGEYDSEYDDLDDYDEGYDVFFGIDDEPTDNPVSEAKAVVQALDNDELDKAVKVVKAVKSDPTKDQESILATLGASGLSLEKIARLLNDLKVLKKQPDWKAMYEQEKAKKKQGRGVLKAQWKGVGKALGRLEQINDKFISRCEKRWGKVTSRTRYKSKDSMAKAKEQFIARCVARRGRKVGRIGKGQFKGALRKIRARRKDRMRGLRSKATRQNIKYCIRHPHKCQKKVGKEVQQKVKAFVSSRPRLKNLWDKRQERVSKRKSRRATRKDRRVTRRQS